MPGVERFVFFTRNLLLCAGMTLVGPLDAPARHRARLDPSEPIFTQRSFVEKNIELDTGWEKQPNSDGGTDPAGRRGARGRGAAG